MRLMAACVSATLLLALRAAAHGATFTVDSTIDAVDLAGGDGVCQTAAGTCTLRAAVQEANASAGADDIALPAGTLFLSVAGQGEDAAATGDLDVSGPLEITGAGADDTVVDGGGMDRVLHVLAGQAVSLGRLTIRNGNVPADPGGGILHEGGASLSLTDATVGSNRADAGAAVVMANGSLSLTRVAIRDNVSVMGEGAVLVAGMGALDVHDSVFERNVAVGAAGGALIAATTGTVSITGSTFRANRAANAGAVLISGASATTVADAVIEDGLAVDAGGDAGCLLIAGPGAVMIERTIVRGCSAVDDVGGMLVATGGAVVLRNLTVEDCSAGGDAAGGFVSAAGDVTVEDAAFGGNHTFGGAGGGLYLGAGANARLTRLTLTANSAAIGGGIYGSVGGNLTVASSRIEGNSAIFGLGGGGYVGVLGSGSVGDTVVRDNTAGTNAGGLYLDSGNLTVVERSTFAGNVAAMVGGVAGGLFVAGGAPGVQVSNSTFSGNLAQGPGGGLYVGSGGSITHTTFTGNASGTAGAAIVAPAGVTFRANAIAASGTASCTAAPGFVSDGYNVDQDGSCGLAAGTDRNGIDPELGPLADNGGPTPTHEPLGGSPLLEGAGTTCPATDQRGIVRPFDADGDGTVACDVGAVEYLDECPLDPDKRVPGACGCGVPDVDANANGAVECQINAELKARIGTARTTVQGLTGDATPEQTARRAQLIPLGDDLLAYCTDNEATILKTDPAAKLPKLARKARKALRAARKGKGQALVRKRAKATRALDALDGAVAPQP